METWNVRCMRIRTLPVGMNQIEFTVKEETPERAEEYARGQMCRMGEFDGWLYAVKSIRARWLAVVPAEVPDHSKGEFIGLGKDGNPEVLRLPEEERAKMRHLSDHLCEDCPGTMCDCNPHH